MIMPWHTGGTGAGEKCAERETGTGTVDGGRGEKTTHGA